MSITELFPFVVHRRSSALLLSYANSKLEHEMWLVTRSRSAIVKKRRKGGGSVFRAPLSLLISYSNRDCLLSSKKVQKINHQGITYHFRATYFASWMDTDMLGVEAIFEAVGYS